MAATDRELWAAAVDGDAEAFGVLFERHSRAVYNFAFRSTADWAAAEDAASDVFLTAWRRRGEVVFTTESGSVLPWLLGARPTSCGTSAARSVAPPPRWAG